MFKFSVGSVIMLIGKKFTIEGRTWKETIDEVTISYICIDEMKDIHKFKEEFIVKNIEEGEITMNKKKVIIGATIICVLGGLSTGGYLLYNHVKSNIMTSITTTSTVKTSTSVKEVRGMDLERSQINETTLSDFNKIFSDFQDSLIDDTTFRGKLSDGMTIDNTVRVQYLERLKPFMDYSYYKDIVNEKSDDVFMEMIKQIYSVNQRHIYNITFVSIGKEIYNGNEVYKASIDVNGVDDKIGFIVQRLNLYMNNDKKIIKVEPVSVLHDQANTATPLSNKSSIKDTTHKEFTGAFNLLINKLKNKNIYNEINEGKINANSTEWKSYASNFNVKDIDTTVLFNMLKKGKGDFKSWGVVAFSHSDIDAKGISTYTIQIGDEETISSFIIDFNRISNKIIKITEKK